MLQKFKYLLVISLLLFTGCEKSLKNGLFPEFNQKLVVMSFISPADTTSYITVTSNRRIFGELSNNEDPGVVTGTISNGTTKVNLKNSAGTLCFNRNDMRVEAGKSYTINISSDKGLVAEGISLVPDKFDFGLKADTSSTIRTDHGYTFREYNFKAEFNDQPEKENYFRIIINRETYDHYQGYPRKNKERINLEKNLFREADLNTEGKIVIESSRAIYFSKYSDSIFLKIYLLNCEESYYLYHKSLDFYSDNENPFTEASPVYSNISGGLGIFTSYTVDSLIMRLK